MEIRTKILRWLNYCYVNKDLDVYGNGGTAHVDSFIGEKSDNRLYIKEGLDAYEEFIDICRENDWLDNFIPIFFITLKEKKSFRKFNISTLDDIVNDMDLPFRPPEIYLKKKIDGACSCHYSNFELYRKCLHNEFDAIFNRKFGKEYEICYEVLVYRHNDLSPDRLFEDRWVYQREINIEYNENNSEIVRNVKRLTLKKK
jgi:hypothetical protein